MGEPIPPKTTKAPVVIPNVPKRGAGTPGKSDDVLDQRRSSSRQRHHGSNVDQREARSLAGGDMGDVNGPRARRRGRQGENCHR